MDHCYVEFIPKDRDSLRRTVKLFDVIKAAKAANDTSDNSKFTQYLGDAEKGYFWNPTPKEQRQWNDEWFSTPIEERLSPDMVLPQWTVGSMLYAFWEGDYEFLAIQEENGKHYLTFNPNGYPFGGTASMVAFLECFGHTVTGTNDGTGYQKHIRQTEFWKPKRKRTWRFWK